MTHIRIPIGFSQRETIVTTETPPLVLLVEDKKEIHLLIRNYLKQKYEIVVTTNGEEAVRLVQEKDFFAIIMDIGLEGEMTGIEATRTIRAMPERGKLPIVVLTAYTMKEMEEQCRAAGCDAFLLKPATRQQLLSLLETFR